MITERLEWEFESAPVREQLRLRNKGNAGPQKIKPFESEILERRPRYHDVTERVMIAIRDLGTCRQLGMSLGPIPITAIWEYVRRKGYDDVAAEIMTEAILAGDRTFLSEHVKKGQGDE